MDRLTVRDEKGRAHYRCVKECNREPAACTENCEFSQEACERLAAYEDLEITPEQMLEIDRMYRILCEQMARLEAERNTTDDEIKWLSWRTLEEWGIIECPMLDNKPVMTYWCGDMPCYYSYTAPFVSDGEIYCYRYDHDEGCWDEDVMFYLGSYEDFVKSHNGGAQ